MAKDNPYGDDGGTRVGKPDRPERDNKQGNEQGNEQGNGDGGNLGSGKEAVRGLTSDKKGGESDSVSSGDLKDRDTEKGSGYGGNMGGPKSSSDKR
jgi:hypothetical protein